jgi:hypothetical protein
MLQVEVEVGGISVGGEKAISEYKKWDDLWEEEWLNSLTG